MKIHLIELADKTNYTILADRWEVEDDRDMHFIKDEKIVHSVPWRKVLFIYAELHKEQQ